ncbi:AAA family ATPase [Altererythrobacter confluentis]|uniref:AAA family ATPase n=1 Tax=Allopontixanthobacter confluentis TaxID=1849021 RepID=A0A6L7GHV3_9SPHN|nr:AAA family ATPase [Allopontixanthobacter confluentis]
MPHASHQSNGHQSNGHQSNGPRSTGPHRITFANEKGGTGKSTTAVHVAVALAYRGAKVAALDLDPRQRTFHRYFENRSETESRRGITLPSATVEVFNGETVEEFEDMARRVGEGADFLIVDTPGRDDPFARHAATEADTLVTPLNDSFVDFDLIGQVDAESFKVRRLSFYAELIWETRKTRALQRRQEIDWVVVRNRTGHVEARNMQRIEKALTELSKRAGFRVAKGLSERVIYRELFPSGLTLLDKGHLGELGTSHLVARQEMRNLLAGLNLPQRGHAVAADAGAGTRGGKGNGTSNAKQDPRQNPGENPGARSSRALA